MPTIQEIRAQYPQYADMSDKQLSDAMYSKFYSDMPRAKFDSLLTTKMPSAPAKSKAEQATDYIGQMIGNIPKSATEFGAGVTQAVTHPAETLAGLRDVIGGAQLKLLYPMMKNLGFKSTPEQEQNAKDMIAKADAVGGAYKAKYGSVDKAIETLKNDPVGFAADASMLLGGAGAVVKGASGAAKAAGAAKTAAGLAKTGAGLTTAAEVIDPMRAITAPVGAIYRGGNKLAQHFGNVIDPKRAALVRATGGQGEEIVNALAQQQQAYPGVTAGEIAARQGNVGLAGLEAAVERTTPQTMQAFESARQARDIERSKRLGEVAMTEQDRAMLAEARKARGEMLYGPVREGLYGPGDVSATIAAIDDEIKLAAKNAPLRNALNRLRNNLHDLSTVPAAPETEGRVLSSVLDELKGERGISGFNPGSHERAVLSKLKEQLVKDIPGMEAAETGYREASRPINRADVGKMLQEKLLGGKRPQTGTPISGQFQPGQYLGAMTDEEKLITQATGDQFYKNLRELFKNDPEGLKKLYDLRDDLQSQLNYIKAKSVGGKGGTKVPAEQAHTIPFLNRYATAANFVVKRTQGKLNQAAAMDLAFKMLDPQSFSEELKIALEKQARIDAKAAKITKAGREAAKALESPAGIATVKMQNALQEQENQNALAK